MNCIAVAKRCQPIPWAVEAGMAFEVGSDVPNQGKEAGPSGLVIGSGLPREGRGRNLG